ncbi:MAG: redoxin domain-containing protein [Rubinisphaera brasiliensis]|uniref:redoxin domain-containing protein n=1 Tax=Rubinisphaera brasiliensis TaxID=119 RepID=UPI00391C687E
MPQSGFLSRFECHRFAGISFFSACLTLLSFCSHLCADDNPKTISSFILTESDGTAHKISRSTKDEFWVVAFLGTECPLAKHYSVRLQKMADEYRNDNVQFVGVMSNAHDSVEDIKEFIQTHKLSFPVCRDAGNKVADLLDAQRTPEVFVIDKSLRLRYSGRIDDQFQIGVIRSQPEKQELKDALDALVNGREPDVTHTEAIGCIIGREQVSKSKPAVTFSNQIVRLFQDKCIDCHRDGQAAPFALDRYEEARGWAGMIAEVVEEERMPPWHAEEGIGEFKNACALNAQEKELIYAWVEAGAPEGDRSQLPQPKSYPTDWLLPQAPDLVFDITEEPVAIPATGEVKYQYYRVDPKLTEDAWIRGAEIRPGNYAVVHHILVFSRKPGERRGGGAEGGFLAAYVPGLVPELYPAGMAKRIPAGSELIFQVHYTPIGSAQTDKSQLALVLANEKDITHEVTTTSATNSNFTIPPGASAHEVVSFSPRARQDVQLLAMMPHMHLRGKSFAYELQTADGEQKPLLSVPRYDFNWQTAYRLTEPMLLPAGSRIKCTAQFDNSKDNPYNPDPTESVKWGDQTWEEMMIGYFDVAIPRESEVAGFGSRANQFIGRLDRNNDGDVSIDEVPAKWYAIFLLIDADRDGKVTAEELEMADRKFRERQARNRDE